MAFFIIGFILSFEALLFIYLAAYFAARGWYKGRPAQNIEVNIINSNPTNGGAGNGTNVSMP